MNTSRVALAPWLLLLLGASIPFACTLTTSGTSDAPKADAGSSTSSSTTTTDTGPGAGGSGGASTTSTTSAGGAPTTTSSTGGGATDVGGAGGASVLCGDSQTTPPEECDDGNPLPGDGCASDCTLEHPDACPGTPIPVGFSPVTLSGDTTGASDDAQASCGGDGAGDFVYAVTPVAGGTLDIATTGQQHPIVYVRSACDQDPTELACSDAMPADTKLVVTANTTYYVVIDGDKSGDEGAFTATLTLSPCGDGTLGAGEECDDSNLVDGDGCDACQVVCAGSHPFEDPTTKHCYDFVKSSKKWQDAEAACVNRGGHLAAISSQPEFDLVDAKDLSDDVWIGGTDAQTEDTWLWTNGEPWSFTHWDNGEPSNSGTGEDCLMQRPDLTWNDDPCWTTKYYLCELPPAGKP